MVIDCGQFHHDSNLTIEILLRVFEQFKVHDYWDFVCRLVVLVILPC